MNIGISNILTSLSLDPAGSPPASGVGAGTGAGSWDLVLAGAASGCAQEKEVSNS